MWDRLNVPYRQLLPSHSTDSTDSPVLDPDQPYGIYEDEESMAQRQREGFGCISIWFAQLMEYFPELSLKERLLGCGTCMVCGYLLSFGSFIRMNDLLRGNPTPLVIHVTLGNIIALCGTCFLSGPTQQVQRMWNSTRRTATTMYLGSLFVTVLVLLIPGRFFGKGLLLLLLIIFQYVAITWYTLSYIPFGRDFLKSICRKCARRGSSIVDDEG